ncbi:hypothetical protein SPAN111604_14830 [Sphingomonas antarctica]|uniref:helix-turn-helix domain-containing protein n=1 Tax=Sphingomonas antarctica TaxID=2040274 RepID=UPI0039E77FEB
MPCPKTPFPRAAVPPDFGGTVRELRQAKFWSRAQLAKKVGVARKTIDRLENGLTTPSMRLVAALLRNEVLGKGNGTQSGLPPVPGWELDEPDAWKRCARSRAARLASHQTLAEVAAKVKASAKEGGSISSLSAFERGMLTPFAFVGRLFKDDGGDSVSEAYAQALGFTDAVEMRDYLESDDPLPWLAQIARRCKRKLPPAALLPTRRVPVLDDATEIPAFLLD